MSPCRRNDGASWGARQFDEHNKHTSFGPASNELVPALDGIVKSRHGALFGMLDVPDDTWQDTVVANDTVDRLSRNHDKPFFMVAGFVRPHGPWTAPKRCYEMYDHNETQLPVWKEDDWNDIPADVDP